MHDNSLNFQGQPISCLGLAQGEKKFMVFFFMNQFIAK